MWKSNRLNILVSYAYFDNVRPWLETVEPDSFNLLIDSGAFTAWTKGVPIDLPEYVRFLNTLDSTWNWQAAQLDVIGDPKATRKNLEIMLDAGISDIIPVFTRGEEMDRLEYLHSLESDFVMVGGIGYGRARHGYIKYFMRHNAGRPIHWFGFADSSFIQKFKPYSVDHSGYASAQMYGMLPLFEGKGHMRTISAKHFHSKPSLDIIQAFVDLGLSWKEIRALGKRAAWKGTVNDEWTPENPRGMVSFLGNLSHILRAHELEKATGTRTFFACVADTNPYGIQIAQRWIDEGKTKYWEAKS